MIHPHFANPPAPQFQKWKEMKAQKIADKKTGKSVNKTTTTSSTNADNPKVSPPPKPPTQPTQTDQQLAYNQHTQSHGAQQSAKTVTLRQNGQGLTKNTYQGSTFISNHRQLSSPSPSNSNNKMYDSSHTPSAPPDPSIPPLSPGALKKMNAGAKEFVPSFGGSPPTTSTRPPLLMKADADGNLTAVSILPGGHIVSQTPSPVGSPQVLSMYNSSSLLGGKAPATLGSKSVGAMPFIPKSTAFPLHAAPQQHLMEQLSLQRASQERAFKLELDQQRKAQEKLEHEMRLKQLMMEEEAEMHRLELEAKKLEMEEEKKKIKLEVR